MKLLLLADIPGWVVERCVDRMIESMPEFECEKAFYTCIKPQELRQLAPKFDCLYMANWHLEPQFESLEELIKLMPVVFSVRSHRFPGYVLDWASRVAGVHVVNQALLPTFEGRAKVLRYIPDGIDDMFLNRPFVVGWAGRSTDTVYKGLPLIEDAVLGLVKRGSNVQLKIATDLVPSAMPSFYRSIDLYVCASEAEGFSTPVMEALAMGVTVLSTKVGEPFHNTDVLRYLPHEQFWGCPRSAKDIQESIKEIMRRQNKTHPTLYATYNWKQIGKWFKQFFGDVVTSWEKTR